MPDHARRPNARPTTTPAASSSTSSGPSSSNQDSLSRMTAGAPAEDSPTLRAAGLDETPLLPFPG